MSAIGTGSSRKSNSVEAVEEALQQARMKVQGFVDWGLIFFSAEHLDQAEKIRQILVENTPGTQWAGCSAGGVLSDNGGNLWGTRSCHIVGPDPRNQNQSHYNLPASRAFS